MNQLTLRKVMNDEVADLHRLARNTFLTAFAHFNDPADMDHYMQTSMTLKSFESQLIHPDSNFYFAFANDERIGYLKLNSGTAQTDDQLKNALEIERLYIDAHIQSKGFGGQMIQFAKEKADDGNYDWLWLGVWEHNLRAIQFYKRHGFQLFSTHEFYLGKDRQTDLLMKWQVSSSS